MGSLLSCTAVCQRSLDVIFFEVVFPSFLVLAVKTCQHYTLFVRESEHIIFDSIEANSTKGFKLFIAIVVDDLTADL